MRAGRQLALLALALAGCNQILGLDPPGGGNHDAVADDDGGPADDGDVRDGESDGDPDAAGDGGGVDGTSSSIPGRVWALDLDYVRTMVPTRGYEATASFGAPAESCTRIATAGSCVMDRCTATPPTVPAAHSNKVTIEGNRLVELVPDSNGIYPTRTGLDGGFFDAAVTTGTYSEGGQVPSFSGTLVAPPLVTLTNAGLPSPIAPATVQRSSGMNLTWSVSTPTTQIYLVITDNGGGRVQCNLLTSGGSGVVPASVLTELVSGPGTLATYTVATTSFIAGNYTIVYTTARTARRSDGDWARGTITLQ